MGGGGGGGRRQEKRGVGTHNGAHNVGECS